MSKKIRFIFIIMICITVISGLAFAQTDDTQYYPGGALVATEQIVTSSSDYEETDESGNGLIKPKASQDNPVQDQKIKQQDNSLSRNTVSALSVMSLSVSLASLIISVYLLLRMRKERSG